MIEYRDVRKSYGDKEIIRGISFTVEAGEFIVIIGPSGCGKTTTVKMLNRLIDATSGSILIDGVDTREMDLLRLRTSVGYVIQQIGLFPNMTVEENISVVPKIMKWSKDKTLARVKELMEMVHMPYDDYAKKYPKQLSGGQQQRVGVLRAMATNPPIIIMDEPFGALDPITREILQAEVKKIQKEFHITILFITHDMHEAMKMADRVIFMDQGVIRQQATPRQMLLHPATEEITRFISLQEVGLDEGNLTAEDIMQRIPDGEVSGNVLTVGRQERLSEIGKHISLSANDPIYVKDDSGKPVGMITIGSILKHLSK
jgi:osmoprotectant transport system ATP-binding protein